MVPIATELATAYITLIPSFKGGTGKIERELGAVGSPAGKRAGLGFGHAFSKAAALAAPLLAGAAILKQVKDVFTAASESRKIAALTEQVIKTTGGAAKVTADQVSDLAAALARKTGVDDEVIQSGENVLLTFLNIRNEAGKGNDIFNRATELANDMSVALGTDMTSASGLLGKALEDPVKGLGKLTRANVSFSDAQKEQIKAMAESGDMLGAQKLLLDVVAVQFGGAAEAAATPFGKLMVVLGDLQEKLGFKVMPVIDKVATWIGEHLPSMVAKASDMFTTLKDRLEPVVGFLQRMFDVGMQVVGFVKDDMVPGIQDAVGKLTTGFSGDDGTGILGGIGDGARKVYDFIKDVAIPGIQDSVGSFIAGLQGKGGEGSFFVDLAEGAMGAFRVFKEDVLPVLQKVASFIGDHLKPILIVLAALFAPGAALIAGFIFAYQKSELFRDIIAGVFAVAKFVVTNAIDAIVAAFNFLLPIVQSVTDFVKAAIEKLTPVFYFLKAVIVDFVFPLIVAILKDVVVPALEFLGDIAGKVFGDIAGAVQTMWAFAEPILSAVVTFIAEKLTPVWDGLVAAASAAWGLLPGIIGAVLRRIGGMLAGFLRGAASVADAVGLGDIATALRSGADSADRWGEDSGPGATDKGQGGIAVGGFDRRAGGGLIPGRGAGDVVPVMATAGEFMMRKSAVAKFGPQFFATLNAGHMPAAAGGGQTIQVTTVANASADEVVAAINAKLSWAHTTRRDR